MKNVPRRLVSSGSILGLKATVLTVGFWESRMRRAALNMNIPRFARFATLVGLASMVWLAASRADGQACTPPPANLISWWTGDGTTLDYFGRNNGLATSPVSYAPGEVADSFSFSGGQDVQVLRSLSLEPSQITVDAWVKATTPGTFRYIISKGAQGDVAASYALYTGSSGGLFFYIFDGSVARLSPDAGAGVWNGTFHHVAGTFDGSAVHLFVDGSEVGTGTPVPNGTSIAYGLADTNDLFIGDYNPNCVGCAEHHFVGDVDELEVFSRALSPTEIAAISSAGEAGKCLPVTIDIKSHSANPSSHGNIPIAILGSAAFDTTDIIQSTILLFQSGVEQNPRGKLKCSFVDGSADTPRDLLCHFPSSALPVDATGVVTAVLTGQVLVPGGQRTFFGTDTINVVPKKK